MKNWKEEVALPFVLTYRVVRKQLTVQIAWWLMDTWWPFKICRRLKMHVCVWWARQYRGTNEFHRSLSMDVWSILQMTESENKAYMDDLMRRRSKLHEQSCRPG
jgi:hypothetical protein